jgi:hypothetical protein
MPNVEKSVVRAPNEMFQSLAQKRSATPAASGPMVLGSNLGLKDGDPGGSANLGRCASPVRTDNNQFQIANAQMRQPPAATMPGQGAIPVDLRVGQPANGIALRDMPKK